MLEPYEGKLSRTVLRGEGGSNALDLPDIEKQKVCRNTRCAFFFFIDYKNRLIFLSCDILRISLIYVFATSK